MATAVVLLGEAAFRLELAGSVVRIVPSSGGVVCSEDTLLRGLRRGQILRADRADNSRDVYDLSRW